MSYSHQHHQDSSGTDITNSRRTSMWRPRRQSLLAALVIVSLMVGVYMIYRATHAANNPYPCPTSPSPHPTLLHNHTGDSFGNDQFRPAGDQCVHSLQWDLNTLGFNAGTIDGVYGSNTANAVFNFQGSPHCSCTQDSDTGPVTWTALENALSPPPSTPTPAPAPTSIIQGYKIGNGSSSSPVSSVEVDYVCCSSPSNGTKQASNPYYFNSLPQGNHRVDLNPGTIPSGWTVSGSQVAYDNNAAGPLSAMSADPSNGWPSVVVDTSGHNYANLWFYFNPPAPPATPTPTPIPNNPTPTPTMQPGPTSNPTPAPPGHTPNPTPAPPGHTPSPTTKPGATPKPISGPGASGNAAPALSTQPPAPPSNFVASTKDGISVVQLNWSAPTTPNGIQNYSLDRSTDNSNWQPLTTTTATNYPDETTTFNVHYYYRLVATDNANLTSQYAFVDVTTPKFVSNTTGGVTVKSDDGLVSATIPDGALSGEASCSIASGSDHSDSLKLAKNMALAEGPYSLICQLASGDAVTTYLKPVQVTLVLGVSQLKQYAKFTLAGFQNSGDTPSWKVQSSQYTKTSHQYSFSTTTPLDFVVLGTRKTPFPWWIIELFVVIIAVTLAALYLISRRGGKENYQDYLHRKYWEY